MQTSVADPGFTHGGWDKDEAPRLSAIATRIEAPQALRGMGCGEGEWEGFGEGRCSLPRNIFRFWISNWRI